MANRSLIISVLASAMLFVGGGHLSSAQAGSRTFQFGGPLPSFTATRHGNTATPATYSSHKKRSKKKAKMSAKKRKKIAKQKVLAKNKKIAARKNAIAEKRARAHAKEKAAKKRAKKMAASARTKKKLTNEIAQAAGPQEPTGVRVAPSTSAVLTQQDVSASSPSLPQSANTEAKNVQADKAMPREEAQNIPPAGPAPTANGVETPSYTAKATTSAASTPLTTPEETCKRYIPAVGLTISVGC